MSWPDASASLPDRLVTACLNGDMAAVTTALSAGANVTDDGSNGCNCYCSPLQAAVAGGHHDIVERLLALGANPNSSPAIMFLAVYSSPAVTLRALIDSGGDVNSSDRQLLFQAVVGLHRGGEERLEVLLDEPSLDLTAVKADHPGQGTTAEQFALTAARPDFADRIRSEVRRCWVTPRGCSSTWAVCYPLRFDKRRHTVSCGRM